MKIKLKDLNKINKMNKVLEEMGIEYKFWSEEDNKAWLNDINTNPESPQKHLKPKGRDLTLAELKEMFEAWTEVGIYETDLYYGRTSEEQMQKIGKFIYNYSDEIEFLDGSDILLERGNIPEEYHSTIAKLEKEDIPPVKLPEDQQYIPNLDGGVLLCKSWGIKPFWVTYGKVERPRFLKEKIYEDNLYNNIYKDKEGHSYLLVPLNDFSKGFGEKVFSEAWDMGLREHPNYFMPMVYSYDLTDIKKIGESLFEFYSSEELLERFKTVANALPTEVAQSKINFQLDKKKGIAITYHSGKSRKLDLLNAFKIAMEKSFGKLQEIQSNTFKFEKQLVTLF
jgi:hypothetical protein